MMKENEELDEFGEYIDEEYDMCTKESDEYEKYDEATRSYLRENRKVRKRKFKIIATGMIVIFIIIVFNIKLEKSTRDAYLVGNIYGSNHKSSSVYGHQQVWWDTKLHITGHLEKGEIYIAIIDGVALHRDYKDEEIIEKITIKELGDIDIYVDIGDMSIYDECTVICSSSEDCVASSCDVEFTYERKVIEIITERLVNEIVGMFR